MPTTAPKIDKFSALSFARELENRIGDAIYNNLEELFNGDEALSIEDIRDCIERALDCAAMASKNETILPDHDTLAASIEDIQNGRCRDLQEVINELSSTNN